MIGRSSDSESLSCKSCSLYAYSAQPFGRADLQYGLQTHFIRMATFLERMYMTSSLMFLSKAVIYSTAHSTIAGTVLCDWFLRAITVEGTRINIDIHQQTAARDVLTPIGLCLVLPADETSRRSCRISSAFYCNAGQYRSGRVI